LEHTRVAREDALRIGAETAGDDDAAVVLESLADRVERLVDGGIDEPAGVDDDDVGRLVAWRDLVSFRAQLRDDALGIHQRLRASEAHEADARRAPARRGGSARACSAMTPVLAHETNGCGGSCYRVAGVPSALTGGAAQPPAHHAVPGRWCARMSAKNTNSTTSGMTSHGQMAGRRSPRILRRSAAIDSHELRLAERLCVHAEADVGRGRIRRHVQARDFERVEPEVVVMRVARRRTRAAVA